MPAALHFISGLPRAGSTLLAAILLQNPAVHAGITSPAGSLVAGLLRTMSQGNETAMMLTDDHRRGLLRSVFDVYYQDFDSSKTVFDTNRGWTSRLRLLSTLFPDSKMICCIRPVPWILDSIERLIRSNIFELSKIFDFDPGGSVYSRAAVLTNPDGLVGFAVNALKQAMHSPEADRLLLLPYDVLVKDPDYALQQVYDFVGLPGFAHDFQNLAFDAEEFDARLGTPGLHHVRNSVAPLVRETVLPPDLWRRHEGESLWREAAFNLRNVRIVQERP